MKNEQRASYFKRAIGINRYRDKMSGKNGKVLSLIDAIDEVMEDCCTCGVILHDGCDTRDENIRINDFEFIRYNDNEDLEFVPNHEAKDRLIDIRLASMFVIESGKTLSLSKTNKYSFVSDNPVVMIAFCNAEEDALELQKKLSFR